MLTVPDFNHEENFIWLEREIGQAVIAWVHQERGYRQSSFNIGNAPFYLVLAFILLWGKKEK